MAGVYHKQNWDIQSTKNNPFIFDGSKQKSPFPLPNTKNVPKIQPVGNII